VLASMQACSSNSDNTAGGGSGGGGGSGDQTAGSNAAPGGSAGKGGQTGGGAGQTGVGGTGVSGTGVGGAGDGLAGDGQGGAAEAGATAFVPDVPEQYVGKILTPGMEVVAHTARETTTSKEWLMAVKNTGTDHLCAIDVSFSFLDSAGTKLGGATLVPLDIPLERGSNGSGGLTSCLAPGKIGMLKETLSLQDVDISKIAKVTHEFGALILTDAAPTDDIKVSNIAPVSAGVSGLVFSGSLLNNGTTGVKNPSVAIYGVNAVGRPLFSSEAIELVTIAAGSSWAFKTIDKFDEPFADFAAYPRVSDL